MSRKSKTRKLNDDIDEGNDADKDKGKEDKSNRDERTARETEHIKGCIVRVSGFPYDTDEKLLKKIFKVRSLCCNRNLYDRIDEKLPSQ